MRGDPRELAAIFAGGFIGAIASAGILLGFGAASSPLIRVPVVTVVIDTPDRIAKRFEIVDELTAAAGLVTSERIPGTPLPIDAWLRNRGADSSSHVPSSACRRERSRPSRGCLRS